MLNKTCAYIAFILTGETILENLVQILNLENEEKYVVVLKLTSPTIHLF